ncbi:unnamed protein product, partial [Vitis vinifera]
MFREPNSFPTELGLQFHLKNFKKRVFQGLDFIGVPPLLEVVATRDLGALSNECCHVLPNIFENQNSNILHHYHYAKPEHLHCTEFQSFYEFFETTSSLHLWFSSSITMSLWYNHQ